jgi:hypothetical protein
MQILAVAGIVAAFAVACLVIYLVGRSLQRRGRDLTFFDPHYPDSMQAAPGKVDITPGHSPIAAAVEGAQITAAASRSGR